MERMADGQNEILRTLKRLEKTVAQYRYTPEDRLPSVLMQSNTPQSISPANADDSVHVKTPTNSCYSTAQSHQPIPYSRL